MHKHIDPTGLSQYLQSRVDEIERDAQIYAVSYGIGIERARYEVHSEYVGAYVDALQVRE